MPRNARAGFSAFRSRVTEKMTLTQLCCSIPFLPSKAGTSFRTAAEIDSREFSETWIAPRTANTVSMGSTVPRKPETSEVIKRKETAVFDSKKRVRQNVDQVHRNRDDNTERRRDDPNEKPEKINAATKKHPNDEKNNHVRVEHRAENSERLQDPNYENERSFEESLQTAHDQHGRRYHGRKEEESRGTPEKTYRSDYSMPSCAFHAVILSDALHPCIAPVRAPTRTPLASTRRNYYYGSYPGGTMKKFVFAIIILALAGAAVFVVGSIHLFLPPNSYAVVFSKTDGWEPEPFPAGEYAWLWQRLLPTNTTVLVYTIEPDRVSISESGSLPSAAVYAEHIGVGNAFDYAVDLDVTYKIRPRLLPILAQDDVLPDDLPEWREVFADSIRAAVHAEVSNIIRGNTTFPTADALSDLISTRIGTTFPDVEVRTTVVSRMNLPDRELFDQARTSYSRELEARTNAAIDAAAAAAVRDVTEAKQIETLERYGEVLSRYPVLLEYFVMAAEKGADPLQLNAIPIGPQ